MNRTTESSISDCDHHPKVKLKTTSDERNKNSSKEDGELSDTITIDSDCELIEKPAPPQVIISDSEDDVIDFCDADYEKSLLTGSGIRGILVQQSNGKRHRNKSDGVESPPSRVWVPLAMENPQNFMKHENNFTGETNQLSNYCNKMSDKILKKRKLSESDYQVEVKANERAKNDHIKTKHGDIQQKQHKDDSDSDCELIEEPPPLIILDTTAATDSSENECDDTKDKRPPENLSVQPTDNRIYKQVDAPLASPAAAAPAENVDENDATQESRESPHELDETSATDFLFRIEFRNEKIFTELKEIIAMGLQQCLNGIHKTCEIIEEPTNNSMAIHENFELHANTSTASVPDIFHIDLTPTPTKKIKESVPEYRSSCSAVFDNESPAAAAESNDARPKRRGNVCFNCDGAHAIKDCKEPKNFAKIRANRQRFSSGKTAERYHIDTEQKYDKFQPGTISAALQQALGLQRNELPLHIMRMRTLGYPPGWFENAKVLSSGMQLIDSQNADNEGAKESGTNDKYDLKKLISYPGFNVHASGVKDRHQYYRLPPMLPHHSIETMMKSLKGSTANLPYKRKKMKVSHPNDTVNSLELTSAEMDIDSDNEEKTQSPNVAEPPFAPIPPPLPSANLMEIPPPPPETTPDYPPACLPDKVADTSSPVGALISSESPVIRRSVSPTLDDLDERKRRILAALDDSTLQSSIVGGDDSLIDDILALDSSSQGSQSTNGPATKTADDKTSGAKDALIFVDRVPSVPIPRSEPIKIPTTAVVGTKEILQGTPVLMSVSPFSSVPTGDAWSSGVSDVIDFENLPESTGKYEQMKSVLDKIRQFTKKYSEFDDDDE